MLINRYTKRRQREEYSSLFNMTLRNNIRMLPVCDDMCSQNKYYFGISLNMVIDIKNLV